MNKIKVSLLLIFTVISISGKAQLPINGVNAFRFGIANDIETIEFLKIGDSK